MPLPLLLQGRLLHHRLQPLFAHLPLALWIGSVLFDVLYMMDGNSVFAAISYYCILIGLISVALSGPANLIDYLEIPSGTRAKQIATSHLSLNLFATILFLFNFFSRHGLEGGVPSAVTRGEILLSILAVILLAISGFFGGLLIYEQNHGLRPARRNRQRRPNLRRVA